MIAFIQANWVPLIIIIGCFIAGYADGVRDTNAKWHKKIAEESTAKTPHSQA
jgi:hypothetical protein